MGGSRFTRWLLPGFTGLVVAFLFTVCATALLVDAALIESPP